MSKRLNPRNHKPGSVIKRFRSKDSQVGVDIVAGDHEFRLNFDPTRGNICQTTVRHVDFKIKYLSENGTKDFFSDGGDILLTGELINQLIRARTWCKANLKQDPAHPHGFLR